jgi:hypothetical protein
MLLSGLRFVEGLGWRIGFPKSTAALQISLFKANNMNESCNIQSTPKRRYARPLETAKYLHISQRSLSNYMADGTIPYIKIKSNSRKTPKTVLFDLDAVDAWLEQFIVVNKAVQPV